jgi:sigma-B regulation protein RsbU (phosphoserine phosphatase)
MEYLEIIDGEGRRRRVELKRQRLLLGREPTCDIYLPHPNVSRRHAQIQRSPEGHWLLQDLNSLNHVYVHDRPVQQIVLESGLEVRIAVYRLTLLESSTVIEPVQAPTAEERAAWTDLGPGWLEQMYRFLRGLLHLEQSRAVLERLAEEFCRIAQPQSVAVGTAGGDRYHWEVVMAPGGNPDPPYLQEALDRARAEDSNIQMWSSRTVNGQNTPGPVPPLCLLFPMTGRSGVIGHVYVHRPRVCPLPPDVQLYLGVIATQTGLIWDNLHLALLRSAQKQIETELRQARQIQIELFPSSFDVHEHLNAFAVNLPSVRVSGDYYDLVRTGPSTVAFVIADAMGHGMPAALMMALVRAGLRMGLALGQPWDKIFNGLDEIVTQARAGAFVTGLVGQIDLDKNELQVVSAGHQLPSILVGGQPASLSTECLTRPWGLDFDCPWQVGHLALGAGDWSILCYTDGITEGGSGKSQGFNTERIAAFHQANHHLSAEDLCQGLLSETAARQASNSLVDDQTVLVLRSAQGLSRRQRTQHE